MSRGEAESATRRGQVVEQRRLERTFPVLTVTPRLARRTARAACWAWHVGEAKEAVTLAVSELVTNAAQHSGSQYVTLRLTMTPRRLRVEVGDESPELPVVRDGELLDEGGRGLRILSQVAARWGVERDPDGKRVWAEFALGADRGRGEQASG